MEDTEMRDEREEKGGQMKEELKKVSKIAIPMVAAALLQYLVQVVSVMMVGRLGPLYLSSIAIATSLTNVTGFSLLSGLVGGLETLCGQAYGAQQYRKVGTYTYSAIISLILVCFPVCVLWIFMDKLLILIGQDPSISLQARRYSVFLIPSLFGNAILKPLVRYLQSQSLILPLLASSFMVLLLHVPVSWALVFKLDLGILGAAISTCFSTWVNVFLLLGFVKYSTACKKTNSGISAESFFGIWEFFRFGVPSAVMVW